jgi:hypothetical protein
VSTGSRSKTSRRDRKEIRERSHRAREHGLPEPVLSNKPGRARPSSPAEAFRTRGVDSEGVDLPAPSGAVARRSVGAWFSDLPASIKVLTGGILILVGIGIYRACQERAAARFDIAPAPQSSSPVEHAP